jgi:hypothetical protein
VAAQDLFGFSPWLWNNHAKNVPCELLANGTTMTRAELMRHALSQALRRVHIGPKKLKLDEEIRW